MSGSIFHWEPKPKEWYDSLPPLVKRGEDREAVIARIVEDWSTDLGESDPDEHIARFKERFGRSPVVENVSLVHEDETGQTTPIDLGEIVRAVEARLEAEGAPGGFCPTRHILIRRCRVDTTSVRETTIRPRWTCRGAMFDEARFFRGTFGAGASFTESVFCGTTSFYHSTFGAAAQLDRVTFQGAARFDGSTFGDNVNFFGSKFGEEVRFVSSIFGNSANFFEARFGVRAKFEGATFGANTRVVSVTFGDEAGFEGTKFGDRADFETSQFGDRASFVGSTFGHSTRFDSSTFGNEAKFNGSTFGDDAWFQKSTFGTGAIFTNSQFGDRAWFEGATFGDMAKFNLARFGDRVGFPAARFRGRLDTFLLTWGNKPTAIRRVLDWNLVRSLGALPVLARISYLSLLVVPLLAGSWNAVAAYFDLTTPMSPAWAVAFFAALFVSLGHLVFQLKAPQVIREKSRDDLLAQRLVHWANATEREQRDLLQRACDAIQAVARLRPWDRNPNLVRRYGEVVWIPGSLNELDMVRHWEEDRKKEIRAKAKDAGPLQKEEADAFRRSIDESRPRFTHEEFRQIVIDEGAKAEFDAAARETPGWCAVSAFLYLSATVLVLWLTASQIAAVLAAVFEPDRRWARVVNLGFFWGIISITGALLFSGAARLAWQPKRQWIRALALWPLLTAAVVLLILRIAAGSRVPAIESASFWLAIAAAAVIITTGVAGCIEWVRHQLKTPEPTG